MSTDGGPAFPVTPPLNGDVSAQGYPYPDPGMTLRDYFAAKAMPVVMRMLETDFNRDLGDDWGWNDIEREQCVDGAYEIADLMLKARQP